MLVQSLATGAQYQDGPKCWTVFLAPGLFGMAAIRARSAVLTDSGVRKTFATSAASTTATGSGTGRPAKRLGRALA